MQSIPFTYPISGIQRIAGQTQTLLIVPLPRARAPQEEAEATNEVRAGLKRPATGTLMGQLDKKTAL